MTIQLDLKGLWLPLITPFKDGKIDETSLRKILTHYAGKDLTGIILAATTGEEQTMDATEIERLVVISAEEISRNERNISLYLGISGSDPQKVQSQLRKTQGWQIDGYLISGPNYLKPSQEGIKQYYKILSDCTERPILIYNIPYRTGVNIRNETMLELAKLPNIVGVKDCCGNPEQSYELLRNIPSNFSSLTGEDPFFYNAIVHGSSGAIVTGAHVLADIQLQILADIQNGQQNAALDKWNKVAHIPKLLFSEPSPAPVKYWLWRLGLIDSPEVRLPMIPISDNLSKAIDQSILEKR